MHENTMKTAEEYKYYFRPKTIGPNSIQSVSYMRSDELDYFFVTAKFDPSTVTFESKGQKFFATDQLYDQKVEEIRKWQKNSDYYVNN